MANEFSISDKGEQYSALQSVLYQEDIEILIAGLAGGECVLSGGVVSAQGSPDMTVAVTKAATLSGGALKATAAGNGTITTAHAELNRIDLVVINSSGAIAVRAGTAAAYPLPPVRTAGDVALARVFVPPKTTQIKAENITSLRVVCSQGPILIYKTVAAETTNNTSSAIHILNKAGSGVVIPNGLFLSGKVLRVRIHGNVLLNSGTPTVTIVISYGGTTMFQDVSAAAVASANRHAWFMEFNLVAQANNDQALGGHSQIVDVALAPTNPTTGIGDFFGVNTAGQEVQTAWAGSAAVDSDAADRTLAVTMTFSVANAANECVVEGATVELL